MTVLTVGVGMHCLLATPPAPLQSQITIRTVSAVVPACREHHLVFALHANFFFSIKSPSIANGPLDATRH